MPTGTVTICIPTHNRRQELAAVLDALDRQTCQDFDIIICDDASSDGTTEWLRSLDRGRCTLLRNEPGRGYAGTMRRLFDHAAGDYIAVLHDHDGVEATWLENMLRLMAAYPAAGMGCCACRVASAAGCITENGSVGLFRLFRDRSILAGSRMIDALATEVHTPLAVTGTLFRREVVVRAGGYRDEWGLAADEDLYRRVASVSDVAFYPQVQLTLTARSTEGSRTLGGWRSIFTLYEFRRDTALRFGSAAQLLRRWRALRLDVMKRGAVIRECVSLWLRGEIAWLGDSLRPDIIPALPTRRPTLDRFSRMLLAGLLGLLRLTPTLARLVADVRHRHRLAQEHMR